MENGRYKCKKGYDNFSKKIEIVGLIQKRTVFNPLPDFGRKICQANIFRRIKIKKKAFLFCSFIVTSFRLFISLREWKAFRKFEEMKNVAIYNVCLYLSTFVLFVCLYMMSFHNGKCCETKRFVFLSHNICSLCLKRCYVICMKMLCFEKIRLLDYLFCLPLDIRCHMYENVANIHIDK